MTEFSKSMIYVSAVDADRPFIKFEIEDYYRNPRRQAYARHRFDSLRREDVLNDFKGIDTLGLWIVMGIISPEEFKAYKGAWACAVYAVVDGGKFYVDVDEEPYRENPERRYCTSFFYEPLNFDVASADGVLQRKIAETTLGLLLADASV